MLVDYLCVALKSDIELQDIMAKAMLRNDRSKARRLISLNEAAHIIGKSSSWLYKNKDDKDGKPNFSYIKSGNSKTSTVLFNANTLVDEYEALISRRRLCIGIAKKVALG